MVGLTYGGRAQIVRFRNRRNNPSYTYIGTPPSSLPARKTGQRRNNADWDARKPSVGKRNEFRSTQRHGTCANRRRKGFTLIEVLIVVVIVALLAGTVFSLNNGSTTDAMQSAMKHNLYVIKSQIELYRADHLGQVPLISNNSLPQLMNGTNSGQVGNAGPGLSVWPVFCRSAGQSLRRQTRVYGSGDAGPTAERGCR